MKNKKRIILITLVCLLTAALMVGGTMAWLTDTDAKENKIKIADVGTTPEEPHWPGDPEDPDDPPVPVYPGVPQAKDPTITVDEGSSPVFVRVLVKIDTQLLGLLTPAESVTFTGGEGDDAWTITGSALPTANSPWMKNGNGTVDGNYTYLEYRYPTAEDGFNESGEPEAFEIETPVFSGFMLKEDAKVEDFDSIDMSIVVVSQCIQAAGQTDADTAFSNLGSVVDAFK